MVKLIYPTVDVFIYDIRQTLLDTNEQIKARRKRFFQKVYTDKELEKQVKEFEHQENDNTDYVQLLAERFEGDLDGFYYALQFNDTYSLQVNYSGEKRSEDNLKEPINIEKIADLKKVIVEHINKTKVLSDSESEIAEDKQGNLGQTWLFWAQLNDLNDNEQDIAKTCYQQLTPRIFRQEIPSARDELVINKLLGGYLFEFWQHPSLEEDYHLLVWLFPPDRDLKTIQEEVESIYFDLTKLFLCRHKIISTYQESRTIKDRLKEKYQAIDQEIALLEKNIQNRQYKLADLRIKLTANLRTISEYTNLLTRLKIQDTTIKVNLNNYQKRLKIIQDKDRNSQLLNLVNFINYVREKYQQNLEDDCAYFSPGITLLEQTIKTIEGIINIEQTQSDRDLNELVATVSAGLGAGAITASLISAQPPTGKSAIEFYGTNIKITLLVVAIGGLVGYFLWKIYLWLGNSYRKKIIKK